MLLKKALTNFLAATGVILLTTILFLLIDFPAITGGGLTAGLGFIMVMACLTIFFITRSVFFLVRHFLSPPFYKYKKAIGYTIIAVVVIVISIIAIWVILHYSAEIDGAGG